MPCSIKGRVLEVTLLDKVVYRGEIQGEPVHKKNAWGIEWWEATLKDLDTGAISHRRWSASLQVEWERENGPTSSV